VLDSGDFVFVHKSHHSPLLDKQEVSNFERTMNLADCISTANEEGTFNPAWPHIAYDLKKIGRRASPLMNTPENSLESIGTVNRLHSTAR
jgi:hypothetical protein